MKCPGCQLDTPDDSKFCKECGYHLTELLTRENIQSSARSERKQVTVLFSDMSGYTAMTERLDPEEVKGIMSDIFADITRIITNSAGHIERFIGDAVMAVFGMPISHELDAVQAIRATLEIHELVARLSPQYERTIGQPLIMHSGLNTGVVVTGEVDLEKGTHGITGDSVNTAARIQGLAKAGEILVGTETFRHTEGYFNYVPQPPHKVKNKSAPLRTYKLISRKEVPVKVHRISGRRAQMIGRETEMEVLAKALALLEDGQGSIVSICGQAGTGKSRLVHEFKKTLNKRTIQWHEGHAYGYAQKTPYYPLINLLSRDFGIEEEDPPSKIREKIEMGLAQVTGEKNEIVPYIGSLFSIRYAEIIDVSPEFWKSHLHSAVQSIVSHLSLLGPTAICFEDLHWADGSFVELLREIMVATANKVLFICVYRPSFSFFDKQVPENLSRLIISIQLNTLPIDDAMQMLKSLLKTDQIPNELIEFVNKKSEGNPFYLEELVNDLIDSQNLIEVNGTWKVKKKLNTLHIPASIQGVLTARIDRLDKNSKRVLQEASVIGRAFLYKILERITDLNISLDQYLSELEVLDLIRKKSIDPEIEYFFKHALIQESVYNGLLIKERQIIHERIGQVIEIFFKDRLPEFYETLSLHYSLGKAPIKAIDYLLKSGEKSLSRSAVDEAHQYYRDALNILDNNVPSSSEKTNLLFKILIKWGFVYYYRGDFKGGLELYIPYKDLANSLDNKRNIGMFYVWLGHFLFQREKLKESYHYLLEALKLGENISDARLIGYACTWLTWNCAELGKFDKGITYGKRAQEILKELHYDHLLFHESLAGIGQINYYIGKWKENSQIGKLLIKYGKEHSNIRCLVAGYIYLGHANFTSGNLQKAIELYKTAIQVSADPLYSEWPKLFLGMAYVQIGQFQEADIELNQVLSFCEKHGYDYAGTCAKIFIQIITIAKGQIAKGIKNLENYCEVLRQKNKIAALSVVEYMVGKIYSQIAEGGEPVSLTIIVKNINFIIHSIFMAKKRAVKHFDIAIQIAEDIGSPGIKGQAYLDLGLLQKVKGNKDHAREYLLKAIQEFQETDNDYFIDLAKEAIASI